MKFIELTMCSNTGEPYNSIIINTKHIERVDESKITRIWLQDFDDYICVQESYNYLKYVLNNNK